MSIIQLFIIYLFIVFFVILISKKFDLIDEPTKRKLHQNRIINTGGLILYFFYLFIINIYELNHNIELIISIGFFICLVGFIDDRINLSPSIKILFILLPCIYLLLNEINIVDLGNYEHIGYLYLGKFQIPFLILALCLLINAINYIDGIDGLLIVFFISFLINCLFLIDNENTIKIIKLLLIPLILNLVLNFLPSNSKLKILSGDVGSLFIGFFVGFLTIDLYNTFKIHPVYLIWPLWYPIYDFIFVTLNRITNKKSVFVADNSHLHHEILKKFKGNHLKTTISFFLTNLLIIYLGNVLGNYSKILSLIAFPFGCLIYIILRFNLNKYEANRKKYK